MANDQYKKSGLEIAIIGMACRVPGANTKEEFWNNLTKGLNTTTTFTDEELENSGIKPETYKNEKYVRRKGILDDVMGFDADFFNYKKPEADVMDPQIRLLHECVYTALEDAAYAIKKYRGLVGLYVGGLSNRYWEVTASARTRVFDELFEGIHFIDKDFSASRVAHKLNFKGPVMTLSTACTSSLTAVHLAIRALLTGECQLALAGGVALMLPEKAGYTFKENSITSADGFCRTFDNKATGTCAADGVGTVVLKLLEDAVKDNDHIYAVIKGSCVNADGENKMSYTAPSPEGIANAAKIAMNFSRVDPETIGYVEAHGTGTKIGDQIEVEALQAAFNTQKKGFCGIGSHKPNIGYLGPASGVISLIKVALSLYNRKIPPSIQYETPNALIDFKESPFYVVTKLKDIGNSPHPFRACVNNFAVGGTNAHVILEEAPARQKSGRAGDNNYLLLLSAKKINSLEKMTGNLADFLKKNNQVDLQDVQYTLQTAREFYNKRRFIAGTGQEEIIENLLTLNPDKTATNYIDGTVPGVYFMFADKPGIQPNLYSEFYGKFEKYREIVNHALDTLKKTGANDNIGALFTGNSTGQEGAEKSAETDTALLFQFIAASTFAEFLIRLGIQPKAAIGFGSGEYVAAYLAGIFPLEDALRLVICRARLLKPYANPCRVRAVLTEAQFRELPVEKLFLSEVESRDKLIIEGSEQAIAGFRQWAADSGIAVTPVRSDYPSTVSLCTEEQEEFRQAAQAIAFKAPGKIFVPGLNADASETFEVSSPEYWVRQLTAPVRIADGLNKILSEIPALFLELTAGNNLSRMLNQLREKQLKHITIDLLKHKREDNYTGITKFLVGLGKLWNANVDIKWENFYSAQEANRIALPAYPFFR